MPLATRQEHIDWCKQRALEYLQPGPYFSVTDAISSLLSDLGKHEETADLLRGPILETAMRVSTPEAAREFINGFN